MSIGENSSQDEDDDNDFGINENRTLIIGMIIFDRIILPPNYPAEKLAL